MRYSEKRDRHRTGERIKGVVVWATYFQCHTNTQNARFGSALSFPTLGQTQRDQYLPVTGSTQNMRGQEAQELSRAEHGIEANDKRNSKGIIPVEKSPARHRVDDLLR